MFQCSFNALWNWMILWRMTCILFSLILKVAIIDIFNLRYHFWIVFNMLRMHIFIWIRVWFEWRKILSNIAKNIALWWYLRVWTCLFLFLNITFSYLFLAELFSYEHIHQVHRLHELVFGPLLCPLFVDLFLSYFLKCLWYWVRPLNSPRLDCFPILLGYWKRRREYCVKLQFSNLFAFPVDWKPLINLLRFLLVSLGAKFPQR